MNRINVVIIFICITVIGCEGPVGPQGSTGPQGSVGPQGLDGVYDKEIRIEFPPTGTSAIDTVGQKVHPSQYLYNFDKTKYVNVDSIVFGGILTSKDTNTYSILDLYNVTDDQVIPNSAIKLNKQTPTWAYSQNIFAFIPSKKVTLALRIRTTTYGTASYFHYAQLYLYRK